MLGVVAANCSTERPRRHRSDAGEGGEDSSAGSGAGAAAATGGDSTGSGANGGSSANAGNGGSSGDVASGGSAGSSVVSGAGGEPVIPENCGDGNLDDGEECDDANNDGGDGCSAACSIEAGCMPGEGCSAGCGNGSVESGEGCDDGELAPEDGCDAECRIEDGDACSGSPSVCAPTNCGDGTLDAGEGCDDGNTTAFDGCSATCEVEPECTEGGCEATCGDGLVSGDEACDDGDTDDEDGCSSDCEVEDGYTCSAASCDRIGGDCVMRLPVTYRDFNGHAVAGGHPDFQPGFNSDGAIQGLVEASLDAEGKPVLVAASTTAYLHGTAEFAQWYRDTPDVNVAIPGEIVLWEDGAGGYVNRWGAAGERFSAPPVYTNYVYGGPGGTGCPDCMPSASGICQDPCVAFGSGLYSACCVDVTAPSFDGNPLFFPIDAAPGILNETRGEGKVPESYGFAGWPWETDVAPQIGVLSTIPTATAPFPSTTHNFNFTTELKVWFRYQAARQIQFRLGGDDDLWVFLNGRLAIDLGGWHVPLEGRINMSAGVISTEVTLDPLTGAGQAVTADAADFGLEEGEVYSLSVFQAERQPEGSSFLIGLSGFELGRSVCVEQ